MNLFDRLFVESLTRRRRVPGEESGVALVEGRHFQPCEFLDPGRNNPFIVRFAEEREKAFKMFWDQFHRVVHRGTPSALPTARPIDSRVMGGSVGLSRV